MADPYSEILKRYPPPTPSAPVGTDPYSQILQKYGTPLTTPPQVKRGGFLSGGPVSDVFDILRTGEFAVGGVMTGKGIRRGIAERTETYPLFLQKFTGAGNTPTFAQKAASFAASLIVDPINLIGIGLPGKALRAVGAAGQAARYEAAFAKAGAGLGRAAEAGLARVAPGAARAIEARRALAPLEEAARIAEYGGIERSVDLAKAIRKDAATLTGNAKNARRLDQALGGYFDAGADATLQAMQGLAQAPVGSTLGGRIHAARYAGERAQTQYLQSLPADVRTFVQKWAPEVVKQDTDFAQNLVRVGMMKPETAAKWEGFHLRRIYEQFEDPQKFVEFLTQTDPAKAAELLGQIERGIPIRKVGQPIPTAVTKAREISTAAERAARGEIPQASSRLVAGGSLASRAIARGDLYAKVAQQFGIAENIIRAHPLASQVFRQMPDTAEWGKLAGQWVPKEVSDTLLNAVKRPEGIERLLTTLTGWFKFSKVILNPATHARNIRTNVSLIHNAIGLGGLNPATAVRAFREVVTNGQAFREAKSVSSAFIDTFTNSEVRQFITDLDQARTTTQMILAPLRKIGYAMSRAYEIEEQVGKMAVYLTMRGKGISPQAAAKAAEVALFNYRQVPPAIAKMRSIGIWPFVTFPYKVATETLPTVFRRPGRLSQQIKVIQRGTAQPPETEERLLPQYMRTGGYVRLPFNDARGRPLYYDLTYELFFGDIGEAGTPINAIVNLLTGKGAFQREQFLPLLTPFGQFLAELALNKSAFTGQELRRKGETETRTFARHLARFAAPGGVYALGETALAKAGLEPEPQSQLARTLTGTRTRLGVQPMDPYSAILSTFAGIRTVPLDVGAQQRAQRINLREAQRAAQSELYSIVRNPNYPPALKQRLIRDVRAKLRQQMEQYRREGVITQ